MHLRRRIPARLREGQPIIPSKVAGARNSLVEKSANENQTLVAAINIIFTLSVISLILLAYFIALAAFVTTPFNERHAATPKIPSLELLLSNVAAELQELNVTYWLLPGLGLLPTDDKSLGRLNPWQSGVDIAVFQFDIMNVILAQTNLQPSGILATESYFGFRLYPLSGHVDDRYDFNTPFVDIVYFHEKEGSIFSSCCDCDSTTVSACTKKFCSCKICQYHRHDIFPLSSVSIKDVEGKVFAPQNRTLLMLSRDLDSIHPAAFDYQPLQ